MMISVIISIGITMRRLSPSVVVFSASMVFMFPFRRLWRLWRFRWFGRFMTLWRLGRSWRPGRTRMSIRLIVLLVIAALVFVVYTMPTGRQQKGSDQQHYQIECLAAHNCCFYWLFIVEVFLHDVDVAQEIYKHHHGMVGGALYHLVTVTAETHAFSNQSTSPFNGYPYGADRL